MSRQPVLFEPLEPRLLLNGAPVLDNGLVAHWEFDDGAGTTAVDSSANSNDGTLVNDPTWVNGVYGDALSFDGADDYVDYGDVLNDTTFPLTVSTWVYRRGADEVTLFHSDDGSEYAGFWLLVNANGQVELACGDGSGTGSGDYKSKQSTTAIDSERWTHVAAVANSLSDVTIYIDGQDAGGAYSGAATLMAHSAYPARAAFRTLWGPTYADGMLDDLRIYDRALSEAEVQTLAANLDVGLAAHWKFDDGAGTTALDSSGNGNHGTLTNGPTWATGVRGGALDFDGVDDHVEMGDILNEVTGSFSVSAWGYRRDGGRLQIINADESGTYRGFWFQVSETGRIGINYGDGTGAGSNDRRSKGVDSAVAAEEWTHITAVVRGATDMTIYVNGVDAGGTHSGSGGGMVWSANPCYVGYSVRGGERYSGLLDDLRVYDRALTGEEVRLLHLGDAPDLVDDIDGGKLPIWVQAGHKKNGKIKKLSVAVRNIGTRIAKGVVTFRAYASLNDTLAPGVDTLLGTLVKKIKIKRGKIKKIKLKKLFVPALAAGNWNLLVHGDATNVIAETNELNNVGVSPRTVEWRV